MSADLASWLLEQIAEDERAAAAMRPGLQLYVCDGNGCLEEPDGEWADGEPHLPNHHANWLGPVLSPARVLAECEAKRRRIDYLRRSVMFWDGVKDEPTPAGVLMLALEALPFADRPG